MSRTSSIRRLAAACLVSGCSGSSPPEPSPPAGPDIVFIVLDTVRSDRTSACGNPRPTTPTLARLASGPAFTCNTVAPASWTLPTHASLFTGQWADEHGAHAITSGVKSYDGWKVRTHTLKKAATTLAETLKEDGYSTVAVSANPVVNASFGLMQGFEHQTVSEVWGQLFADDLLPALQAGVAQADPDKPLFLFLNIADAHQPWAAVPPGVDWVTPRRARKYRKERPDSTWAKLVGGKLSPEAAATTRTELTEHYDYALSIADLNLGRALEWLERSGTCADDCRIVVTSDHGELLGEQDLLDHGHYAWPANTRVPLWFRPATGDPMPTFGPATSGLVAYSLARTGAVPDAPPPAASQAWPHVRRCARTDGRAFCDPGAAVAVDAEWAVRVGDRAYLCDTATDPACEQPAAMPADHPLSTVLQAQLDRVVADQSDDGPEDTEVTEKLRQLGYLD